MSTKVYEAYRLKKGVDLFAWASDTRRKAEKNVVKMLRALYEVLRGDFPDKDEFDISELFREQYLQTRLSPSVSIVIWKVRGRYYLVPYDGYPFTGSLAFLRRDRRLEPYYYFNNTDRPKHISKKEWKARGRLWEKNLECHGGDAWWDRLILKVFCKTSFWRMDPAVKMKRERYAKMSPEEKKEENKRSEERLRGLVEATVKNEKPKAESVKAILTNDIEQGKAVPPQEEH